MPNDLVEREAIRELTVSYCFTADNRDGDGWAACFTTDAVVDFGPMGQVQGRPAIRSLFEAILRVWSFMFHQVTNHRITVTGPESAEGLCYFNFHGAHNGEPWVGTGTYADRFRREGGRWKIAERRATFRLLVPLKTGWGGEPRVIPPA